MAPDAMAPDPMMADRAGPPMAVPLRPAERALVERAQAFAAEELAPEAAGWEQRREALPRVPFLRYGAAGFSGLMVPAEQGGQGASFFCKVAVAEVMARACLPATFALNNTQSSVVRLAREGTPGQRARFLPGLLRGELVCALSLTEPGAGSDASAMATRATRVVGGWRLDGVKSWITNGMHADLLLLYAQTEPGRGAKGIASFLVDLRSPGVGARVAHRMMGGSATGAAEIAFDGVFVPEEDVAAPPGQAFRAAMRGIIAARVHVAAMVNGVMAECLARAVDHAGSRRAFGATLMEHQGLRWSLADVATRLEASRLLTLRAAMLVAGGEDATFEAAQAKAYAAEVALPAVAACMQAMGAAGLTEEQPFARHLAAVRMAAYADGTTEMQRDRVGAMLGARYGGGRHG